MIPESMQVPGGGILIPWDMVTNGETSWSIKIGVCPNTESLKFEICSSYGTSYQSMWHPLSGKISTLTGIKFESGVRGGPAIYRGKAEARCAIRVVIQDGTGFKIPVHVQFGTISYVGIISTNSDQMFIIDEENTLEELLKGC